MEAYYQVGQIVNTHGTRGEVRVLATTDFPEERFTPGATLTVFVPGQVPRKLTVTGHRKHKQFDLLTFAEITDMNLAEQLKGGDLKVNAAQQDDLAEGNYYYRDIVGLQVETQEGRVLGKITEIMTPGANDVWVVARDGQDDLLLPAIKDVVKRVDLENHRVIVDLLEGLE